MWFLFQLKSQSEQVLCVKPQANTVQGDNVLARMLLDTLRKVPPPDAWLENQETSSGVTNSPIPNTHFPELDTKDHRQQLLC